jgi:hypothetical protein
MCLLDPTGESPLWTYINMGLGEKKETCKSVSMTNNIGNGYMRCGEFVVPDAWSIKSITENEKIDNLISPNELKNLNIGLLKMDVEGYEKFVIMGGQNFFNSPQINRMLLEFLPFPVTKWVYDWLIANGFKLSTERFFGPPHVLGTVQVDVYAWKE